MGKNRVEVMVDIKGQASQLENVLNSLQQKMNLVGKNTEIKGIDRMRQRITQMQDSLSHLQRIGADGIIDEHEIKQAEKSMNDILRGFNTLSNELQKWPGLSGKQLLPTNFANDIREIQKEVLEYDKLRASIEKTEARKIELQKKLDSATATSKKTVRTAEMDSRFRSLAAKGKNRTELEEQGYQNLKNNTVTAKQHNDATAAVDRYIKSVKTANESLKELKSNGTSSFDALKNVLSQKFPDLAKATNINELKTLINKLPTEKLEEIKKLLNFEELSTGKGAADALASTIDRAGNSINEMSLKARNIEQLKNQLLGFFSISNAANLFRRALQTAIQSISDLDKAMTETAVVTDYTVSDMWDQLSQYTQLANQLGATTVGAYQTMTLYFQQGLNQDQAMQLGTETMKMARIAGMDYAETTDAMTAALRGFNMELNETSAKRVNDVYSELAAITASDTQEIATSMSKTASLASSVGLDIETTATYLAEAIETTREAPENIGTAMKTIIARYASLTKDPAELTEEMQEALEGETVDVNSTTKALSAAGISALDTAGNFRDLGSVFLELNEKWDSLSMMQQRYIATQFAGTRQQSRFIAMMQNYARTQELLGSAYDSEGASEKQFGKTLDSLEAKTNELKNAWNNFTMGILNSDVLKSGITVLTGIIGAVDSLTSHFGDFGNIIAKVGVLWGTFKLGGNLFDVFLRSFKSAGTEGAAGFSKTFKSELTSQFSNIGQTIKNTFTKQYNFKDDSERNIYRKAYNEASKGGNTAEAADAAGIDAVAKARVREAAATREAAIAEQQKIIADEQSNITTQQAIINDVDKTLTKKGLTTEERANAQAMRESAEAAIAESKARQQVAASEAAQARATVVETESEVKNSLVQSGGFASNLKNYGKVLVGNKATAQAAAAELKSVGAAGSGAASAIAKIPGPVKAVGAALGIGIAIWSAYRQHIEETCEKAQQAISDYNESVQTIGQNRETIESVRSEFTELAKGVSSNGKNIGLSADEYSRYNEIVSQLVEISPELIKGYNDENQAIIDRNTAIQEAIKLQDEEEARARKTYTSNSNLKAIQTDVNEKKKDIINSNEDISDIQKIFGAVQPTYGLLLDNINNELSNSEYVRSIADTAEERRKFNKQELDAILDNKDATEAEKEAAKEAYEEKEKVIKNAIDLNEEYKNTYKEITDALVAYAQQKDEATGQSLFDKIPDNLQEAFKSGIESISFQDKSPQQLKETVDELADSYQKLGPTVSTSIDNIEKKREEFLNSDRSEEQINKFNKDIHDSVQTIEDAAQECINSGDEMQIAIGQSLMKLASDYSDFASNAKLSLVEALNPFKDMLTEATKLEETLEGISETDYYAASDSYSNSIDTALETKNKAGYGSRTYDTVAQNLLSDKLYKKYTDANTQNEADKDKIALDKTLKKFQQYFKEGEDGGFTSATNFYNDLISFAKKNPNIGIDTKDGNIDIDNDKMDQVAEKFGMQTEAFVAALEHMFQFTQHTWGDPDQIASALKTDENVLHGTNKQKGNLVTEDYLRQQATAAGVKYNAAQKSVLEKGAIVDFAHDTGKEIANALKTTGVAQTDDNKVDAEALAIEMLRTNQSQDDIQRTLTELNKANQLDAESKEEFFTKDGEYDTTSATDYLQSVADLGDDTLQYQGSVLDKMDYISALLDGTNGFMNKDQMDAYDNQFNIYDKSRNNLSDANKDNITAVTTELTDAYNKYNALKDKNGTLSPEQEREQKRIKGTLENYAGLNLQSILKEYGMGDEFTSAFQELPNTIQESLTSFKILAEKSKYIAQQDENKQAIINGALESGKIKDEATANNIVTNVSLGNYEDVKEDLNKLGKSAKIDIITSLPNLNITKEQLNQLEDDKSIDFILETAITGEINEEELNELQDKDKEIIKKVKTEYSTDSNQSQQSSQTPSTTVNNEALQNIIGNKYPIYFDADWKGVTKGINEGIEKANNTKSITADGKGVTKGINAGIEKANNTKSITANASPITTAINAAIRAAKQTWNFTAKVKTIFGGSGKKGKDESGAFGKNLAGSQANPKRGRIGPRGKGGPTLTGELGPELVWYPSGGYSYLTGANGPEMLDLPGDAVVWPADQTKKIMRGMSAAGGKNIYGSAALSGKPRDPSGGSNSSKRKSSSSNSSKSKSSSSSSSKNKSGDTAKKWVETLDRLYNLEQQINYQLELREKYNWEYERMLAKGTATVTSVYNNFQKQIKALKAVYSKGGTYITKIQKRATRLEKNTVKAKKKDSDKKKTKWGKYSRYAEYDNKTNTITLHWKAINKLKKKKGSAKAGEKIENYISKLESIKSAVEQRQSERREALDTIEEIRDTIRDKYIGFTDELMDAYVEQRENELDRLESINNSIDEGNSKLLNSIRSNIERVRQAQENEKTENELSDMYQQLAVLQRDSSGKNKSAILDLQKQIQEAETSYQNSLVDQNLSDLEKQNSDASQQRQEQIEILKSIDQWNQDNGQYWSIIAEYLKAGDALNSSDKAAKLLQDTRKYRSSSTSAQAQQMKEWNDAYSGQKVATTLTTGDTILAGKTITTEKGNTVKPTVDRKIVGGDKVVIGEYVYSGLKETVNGYTASQGQKLRKLADIKDTINKKSSVRNIASLQQALKKMNILKSGYLVDGEWDLTLEKGVKTLQQRLGLKKKQRTGIYDKNTRTKLQKNSIYNKYKEGGLVNYTGPAWLDGTPSKPELVLNSKDAANFIQLKNILSNILGSGTNNSINEGNMNFEININVEKMTSDYDVDDLTKKIKQDLSKSLRYRNNNTINHIR